MRTRTSFAVCLLGALLHVGAHAVPDEPIVAIEPALSTGFPLLAYPIAWMNDRILLVTSEIRGEFHGRKVTSVDVTTGETRELVNPGSLICTSPARKVAGVVVGTTGRRRMQEEPEPQLKVFAWNESTGLLDPESAEKDWNPWICRKTRPDDVDVPESAFLQKNVRYLEAGDGYLATERSTEKVALVRDGKAITGVDARPLDIDPVPQYLPFRAAYLLRAGAFEVYTTIERRTELQVSERPVLMMTRSGSVSSEPVGTLFQRNGLSVAGQTYPYAKGTLIVVPHEPKLGGGIYLKQGDSLKRVWCSNERSANYGSCAATAVTMSPNGCRVAFFSPARDDPKVADTSSPMLKILSLCK